MTQTSDFTTHTADGRTMVSLPEQALVESGLEETRAKLLAIVAKMAGGALVLDFNHVDFLGSSALGMLVALHRRITDGGGQMVLDDLAPHLVELFRLTRLDTILDVRERPARQ